MPKLTPEHLAKLQAGREASRLRKQSITTSAGAQVQMPAPDLSNLVQAQVPPVQTQDMVQPTEAIVTPDPSKPETIPPNLFSGMTRRLEFFGEREGFRRRWFNDESSNVRDAIRSGWTFVERTDVQLNAAVTPRNADLGSKIQQAVGVQANGQTLNAYLMEKPEWLCNEHDFGPGSREAYHKKLEEQIRAGTLGIKAGESRYSQSNPYPGSPSTLPPISYNTKINR